jgi:hypothetical protein
LRKGGDNYFLALGDQKSGEFHLSNPVSEDKMAALCRRRGNVWSFGAPQENGAGASELDLRTNV